MSLDELDPASELEAIAALEEALDQPSDQRMSFLQSYPTANDRVRQRALDMLRAGSSAALVTGGANLANDDEPLPDAIGPYRVLRLIGRGGMGNVYLAERASGDFDHTVAIKVIKHRLISPEIVERFRSERQILANLNHPNIARLFDGGETEDGAPYFVMEFVDGEPMNHWLRGNAPNLADRLSVFRQVCDAVQAAHQNLIVHRDLTPPNILVTEMGHAKVIDFGIARSEDVGGETRIENSAHTPGFAAPEQRQGAVASTLTDIYALGRLLELLTEGESSTELTAIIRRATQESPSARYQSVSALIEDLDNFSSHRPVHAMGGGLGYAAIKLARRQTGLVIASGMSLAALMIALVVTLDAYREADIAQMDAQERLAETRALASTMMFDLFDEVSDRPGNSQARLMLATSAQRHLEDLANDPEASDADRLVAARGFIRLAAATGTFGTANAGDIEQGIRLHQLAIELLSGLSERSSSPEIAMLLARSHTNISRDKLLSYFDLPGAVTHAEEATGILEPLRLTTPEMLAEYGRAQRHLGDGLACCANQVEKGALAIRKGLERIERAPQELREDERVRRARNDLLNLRAGFEIFRQGDEFGIPVFRQALALQRTLARETDAAEDHQLEAIIASNLARTLLRMGDADAAGAVIAPTHEQTLAAYRADPQDNDLQRRLSITSILMATIAAGQGLKSEASKLIDEGMRLARQSEGAGLDGKIPPLNYAHRLHEAAQAMRANRQIEQSCETAARSVSLYLAYAKGYELPETTLRYRLLPLRQMQKDCVVKT